MVEQKNQGKEGQGREFVGTFSSKTKGPGEKGAPRNHPEISSQKLADSSADFPMTSMEETEHHFGPF